MTHDKRSYSILVRGTARPAVEFVHIQGRSGRAPLPGLLEHSLSSVHPRVFFNFFEKSILYGGYIIKTGGINLYLFLIPGTNLMNLYLGSEGGYITVSTISVVLPL
jgi:hypothetical protein